MNAAAKLLHQNRLSRQGTLVLLFTRTQRLLSLFLFLVFMSSLSVIYMTNLTRELNASLYQGRAEYSRLYGQQGQLLLERGTLGMQARVQRTAEKTFNMIMPGRPVVVMIHE